MNSPPPIARPTITDSPWFWLLLFSAAGIAAVMLIAPRYQPRQRRLEMQYMAREEVIRRQAAGEPAARERGQEGEAAPPAATDLIIPLWPLLASCMALLMFSSVMLWRSQQPGRNSHAEE